MRDDTDAAIEQTASEWVMRQSVPLSGEDQQALETWLAADPRHAAAHARLTEVSTVFDRARTRGVSNDIVERLHARAQKRRWRRGAAIAAAAVMIAWFALPRFPAPNASAPFVTPAGIAFEPGQKLPDGSVVELNHGAQIDVQYDAGVRRVQLLKGEAFFLVEKDPLRPFIVQAGEIDVRAIGTSFAVQLAAGAVEVVVATGQIAVDRAPEPALVEAQRTDAAPTVVAAGNRVVVQTAKPADGPLISPLSSAELDERLAWRTSQLEFGGMELSQAVALMNRFNRVQLSIEDPSVGSSRISGVFRSDNVDGFVHIVEATFNLTAERRGENTIVLRRR